MLFHSLSLSPSLSPSSSSSSFSFSFFIWWRRTFIREDPLAGNGKSQLWKLGFQNGPAGRFIKNSFLIIIFISLFFFFFFFFFFLFFCLTVSLSVLPSFRLCWMLSCGTQMLHGEMFELKWPSRGFPLIGLIPSWLFPFLCSYFIFHFAFFLFIYFFFISFPSYFFFKTVLFYLYFIYYFYCFVFCFVSAIIIII